MHDQHAVADFSPLHSFPLILRNILEKMTRFQTSCSDMQIRMSKQPVTLKNGTREKYPLTQFQFKMI